MTPELAARSAIDAKLQATGWAGQDHTKLHLAAERGGEVRESSLKKATTTVNRHGSTGSRHSTLHNAFEGKD